jgi:DNA-binding LacI/PurR family transcriptional regulator
LSAIPPRKVWDYPHWIAHVSFDGLAAGTYTATELFKTFKTPGQGKIIALQGRLGDTPNGERWEGLQLVLSKNPGIQLLQWESAQWDRTQAYQDTKAMLVAHPDVDGVWTANDDMAMGAIQALKEAGLAGKVLVTGCDGIPEMFAAIKVGRLVLSNSPVRSLTACSIRSLVNSSSAWRPAMARISWMLWWHMMKRKTSSKTTQPACSIQRSESGVNVPKIDCGQ